MLPLCDDDTEYTCDNGDCYLKIWKFDKFNDCSDHSDEKNCGKNIFLFFYMSDFYNYHIISKLIIEI